MNAARGGGGVDGGGGVGGVGGIGGTNGVHATGPFFGRELDAPQPYFR